MTVVLAAASHAGWITAAIGVPGAIIVLLALAAALARVFVAGAFPDGEKLAVERTLGFFGYPMVALALGVIVVRFSQLAI